jgi:hypothetical protein
VTLWVRQVGRMLDGLGWLRDREWPWDGGIHDSLF